MFINYEENVEFFKEEVEWKRKRENMKGMKGKVSGFSEERNGCIKFQEMFCSKVTEFSSYTLCILFVESF